MPWRIFALLMSLTLAIPAQAFNWSGVFRQLQPSVAQLFHSGGNCTAFSINRQQQYYLTAQHCLGEEMTLWKETTAETGIQHAFVILDVVKASRELDVAVLRATEGLRAVTRGSNPRVGEEVTSIGYAFGEPEPWLIASTVARSKTARSYDLARFLLFKDNQDIPGMSGGPVLDTKGRLVGMVQSGVTRNGQVTNIAYGTAISDIYNFTRAFWER